MSCCGRNCGLGDAEPEPPAEEVPLAGQDGGEVEEEGGAGDEGEEGAEEGQQGGHLHHLGPRVHRRLLLRTSGKLYL